MNYFQNKLCQPQSNKLARGPSNLGGSRVELQGIDDRFASLLEYQVLHKSDRKCMHSGMMSQCYINITSETFLAKTSLKVSS